MFRQEVLDTIKHVVVERLKNAPDYLTYHNLAHTLDVTEQVARIAKEENISEPEQFLLQVAALYHDIGYLDGPENHEARGCKIFAGEADNWGFSKKEIETVQRIVMATKVPQTPKNKLEEIICDADLDYLGREDFLTTGKGLKKEYLHFGIVKNVAEWEEKQIHFLQKHRYFTKSSKLLREPRKQQNLLSLLS